MKTLTTLILLFASLATISSTECLPTETCLIDQKSNFLVKTVPIVDDNGIIVGEDLSTSSTLADTLHQKAEYCFQGEPYRICDILNLMAYDEGHALITGFSCQVVNGKVDIRYQVYYDMGPGIEQYAFLMMRCDSLYRSQLPVR